MVRRYALQLVCAFPVLRCNSFLELLFYRIKCNNTLCEGKKTKNMCKEIFFHVDFLPFFNYRNIVCVYVCTEALFLRLKQRSFLVFLLEPASPFLRSHLAETSIDHRI